MQKNSPRAQGDTGCTAATHNRRAWTGGAIPSPEPLAGSHLTGGVVQPDRPADLSGAGLAPF